jgi:hypothetical protein
MKLVVFLMMMLAGAEAHADGGGRWFGWETIVADAGSVGIFFTGVATHTTALEGVGTAGLILGAPIIDIASRQPLKGGISMAVRITAAIVFVTGGSAAFRCLTEDTCASAAGGVGFTMFLGAAIVDALVLSHVPVAPVLGTAVGPSHAPVFGLAARF